MEGRSLGDGLGACYCDDGRPLGESLAISRGTLPIVRSARGALHFVWFRGDEYLSAVRVWGKPDFFHMSWDRRARREIAPGDTVVFARGEHDQEPREINSSDIVEKLPP